MANYELTVSMGYVPTWTHVEAVREIFQNAKDEETVNPQNKMFFDYNEDTETLLIGNKIGKLDKSTLLIGISDKRGDDKTIGQHGEGYKIATVVLLREGLSLKVYNFGCNEVWTARKIKSRRYGVEIPSFDITKAGSILRPVENHDLVFEIKGITPQMYNEIKESNLYLQGDIGETKDAGADGRLLLNPTYKGKIFVSGLYVCTDSRLNYGYDFAPCKIQLDRDRHTIAGWGLQSATTDVIASTRDVELIKNSIELFDGEFLKCRISTRFCVTTAANEMAEEFFEKYGSNAVAVTNEDEKHEALSMGAIPCIVSQSMAEFIRNSSLYNDNIEANGNVSMSLSDKLEDWFERIKEHLPNDLLEEGEVLIEKITDELY